MQPTPSDVNGPHLPDESPVTDLAGVDALTDSELGRTLFFGVVVGTPMMFVVVVMLCVLAGLGIGNAVAVAALPAFFSSVFFGGIIPLMRHTARHERLHDAARVASPAAAGPVRPGDEVRPAGVTR